MSPAERNSKLLSLKFGKRYLQLLDFEDNPVPVKKERHEQSKQTTKKDILNTTKCNNDHQSNGSALDVSNTPVVVKKSNLQANHREMKATKAKESNEPRNFEVSHPVLIDEVPEGLDNLEEFLDISQHNDDGKLNGSALDIINNTSIVDVEQELKRDGKKTKSAKENFERVNFKVSNSVPVNKKAEELNNLEDNRQSNGSSSNNLNRQVVDKQKGFTRHEQSRTEPGDFSTINREIQKDECLVQESKPKCPMDCISQTVKNESDNEAQKENVKLKEVIDGIQEVKSTETINKDNNIDNRENGDEDNIEIVFEIEDDDGNVQIELLEISEVVAKQLMEK